MENIDIDIDIDKDILENIDIDIDKEILENIDIDIDIDKEILENTDIDKISNRLEFGISNRVNFTIGITQEDQSYQNKVTENAFTLETEARFD